jgi:hypothetical protein
VESERRRRIQHTPLLGPRAIHKPDARHGLVRVLQPDATRKRDETMITHDENSGPKCWDCGAASPDVLRRRVVHRDGDYPALCTTCCSSYPGRAWMQKSEADLDQQLADARAYWQQLRAYWQQRKDTAAKSAAVKGTQLATMPQVPRSAPESTLGIPQEAR